MFYLDSFIFFSTIAARRREGGKVRSNYGRVTMQTPEEIHPLSPPSWAIFQSGQEALSVVSVLSPPTAKYTVTRILSAARAYFENIAIGAYFSLQKGHVDVGLTASIHSWATVEI